MTPRRPPKKPDERRRAPLLRDLLDELVEHVRNVAQSATVMSREDLEYAQDRLEWLAHEIWQTIMEYPKDKS
ncbi:MAG: hypothetical protein IID06_11220 [Gemmatimonadetes bacterium]|nr:hypothetical protein [Gemmatimonadota bacterium]